MLDTILDRAIDIVGLVARDVYDAIYGLTRAETRLADAIGNSQDLEHVVNTFLSDKYLPTDVSHRIVCVYPEAFLGDGEVSSWVTTFRSRWVQRKVVEQLAQEHRKQTPMLFSKFKDIPHASSMVGYLFEGFAHRALLREDDGDPWPLFLMEPGTDTHSPTFKATADRTPATVTLPKVARKEVYFNAFPNRLEDQYYYIPVVTTFPLIDSFTVDIDATSRSATLWLFQMTKSHRHDGSDKGYVNIRKLIAILCDQLKDGKPPPKKAKTDHPPVTVRYVLVSPADNPNSRNVHAWKMPPGWCKGITRVNHQGNMYLLEVPL